MICIENIGSYIPPNRKLIAAYKSKFEIDDDFILNKLGVEYVSRKLENEETSDLCVSAFQALQRKSEISLDKIDCITVCTQNPDGGGIPHTSAVVHQKLHLHDRCACFDISLGCSGYVYSLSIVKSFMEANNFKTGLLFTSDPYSKIISPDDRNTMLLFGDAATVTLLREPKNRPGLWLAKKFCFATRGSEGDALHNREHELVMNGRSIFNFCVTQVPIQVRELLDSSHMSCEDIDLFLFHQGSKFMVEQIRKRLGLPENKVPIKISCYGNTVSSSIPLLLEECLDDQSMDNLVLSGFGVGLSWASCLISRDK
jgi:3-oxoacyl-[acyl-carrier-protein] synthase III